MNVWHLTPAAVWASADKVKVMTSVQLELHRQGAPKAHEWHARDSIKVGKCLSFVDTSDFKLLVVVRFSFAALINHPHVLHVMQASFSQ